MIIGIGTDILQISRIANIIESDKKDAFIKKVLSNDETKFYHNILSSNNNEKIINKVSKIFSIKESFFKALGCGFTNGVSWQDASLTNDDKGKPVLTISVQSESHKILSKLSNNKEYKIDVSISDDGGFVLTFCTISY